MMKLDFNLEMIRKNRIELLDCQLDLILKSLEMYSYIYKFVYPRRGKCETKEDELRISLVNDTYEQIVTQYGISRTENAVLESNFKGDENFLKKVS